MQRSPPSTTTTFGVLLDCATRSSILVTSTSHGFRFDWSRLDAEEPGLEPTMC